MSKRTGNLITRLAIMFVCQFCAAQAITVAAAADLQFAMQDVAAKFQKETGKEVKLIYGSALRYTPNGVEPCSTRCE